MEHLKGVINSQGENCELLVYEGKASLPFSFNSDNVILPFSFCIKRQD